MTLESSSDDRAQMPLAPVPEVLADVAGGLVQRRLASILAGMLLLLIFLQGFCIFLLVERPPRALYVPESTILHPFILREAKADE